MSEMISESGAVREPNEIAASDFSDAPAPALSTSDDPAMMADPVVEIASFEFLDGEDPDLLPPEEAEDAEGVRVSLSSSLENLANMRRELQMSGSISRSEAATLKQLTTSCESIVKFFDRMPIGSYTEMSSKVNYSATMEGLLGSIVDALINLIKTVAKFVVNIAKWVFAVFTARKMKDRKFDTADKMVKTAYTKSEKTEANTDGIAAAHAQSKFLASANTKWNEFDHQVVAEVLGNGVDTVVMYEKMGAIVWELSIDQSSQYIANYTDRNFMDLVPVNDEVSQHIFSPMLNHLSYKNPKFGKSESAYPDAVSASGFFIDWGVFMRKVASTPRQFEAADVNRMKQFTEKWTHEKWNQKVSYCSEETVKLQKALVFFQTQAERGKSMNVSEEWTSNRSQVIRNINLQVKMYAEFLKTWTMYTATRDKASQILLDYSRSL